MGISLKEVTKEFGTSRAVDNITLDIPTGDFTALLGPSGSGKTTLLRLIAGLEKIDAGTILLNGSDFSAKTVRERKVGFVFQHYALFKHMNIFDNIAFGLKVRPRKQRPSKKEITEKVMELLKLVQLEHTASRYPSQLSGGQRQRIALARALAIEPEVLLLDEPFGALDAKVRQELRHWLREIHQKLNITTLFVTHDQEEALEMADTIVVMNHGRVEQIGPPEEVYQNPANAFVYSFLGRVNELRGAALRGYLGNTIPNGDEVGYIRPHEIGLNRTLKGSSVPTEVSHVTRVGSTVRIDLKRLDLGHIFEAEMSTEKYRELGPVQKGDILYADLNHIVIFNGKNNTTQPVLENKTLRAAYL